MSEEEKAGETTETPTPEETKSVQDLIDEKEAAEAQPEGELKPEGDVPEGDGEPKEGDEPSGDEGKPEGDPPEPEGEQKPRTVPVTALQKERQKRREEQVARVAAEERAAVLEAQVKQAQTQQPKLERPQPSQFDTHDDYLNALGVYVDEKANAVADERVNQRFQAHTEQQQQAEANRKAAETNSRFNRVIDKAHEEDGFEESFKYVDSVALDQPALSGAIINSDVPDKLVKYLAEKPEELERIAGLSEVGQIKAIGAIEDKITAPPPKPKKKTEAPRPVKPVGGDAPTGKGLKWKEGMTKAEKASFMKEMDAQGLTMLDVM